MKLEYEPYLIQRLLKPQLEKPSIPVDIEEEERSGKTLSQEFLLSLKSVMCFEYMGSAEFEWGAIPRCLYRILDNREEFFATKFQAQGKDIYIICKDDEEYMSDIQRAIKRFSISDYGNRTKETVGLYDSLIYKKSISPCGWLDIQNDFFFFTDRAMFEGVATLFYIKQNIN